MALTLHRTGTRFAKSTHHLISHLSKQFGKEKNGKNNDENEETKLSEEENAIRCKINFERLLHKTLQFVQRSNDFLQNPNNPPLAIRVDQNYKSLECEFEILSKYEENEQKMNEYRIKMEIVKKWLMKKEKIKQSEITQNEASEHKNEELKKEIIQSAKTKKKDWKIRKRRRIMRFSEKLSKELEEQKSKNEKMNKNERKNVESDRREELVKELESMTKLLKKGVVGLRETLKKDKKITTSLDEETYGTLDKVSALNQRLSKYVESTSGMSCTMCLMLAIVVLTWIWCFTLIYFI